MKKNVKPAALFPILLGAAVGIILFMLGDADDSPGLSLIGLTAGFLLIMWGINNTGMIKKGFLTPILLFCFGAGGILLSAAMLLHGEFEESPGLALIGVALGVVLIVLGILKLRTAKARLSL